MTDCLQAIAAVCVNKLYYTVFTTKTTHHSTGSYAFFHGLESTNEIIGRGSLFRIVVKTQFN